ncbi:UNVERIFIED_CONTAM: Uridine nucleosidase 1 [Sesamum radiatum]|uniref:Uridine nucleosidase 1 n=1 Tax=Sesamum radiatum TaxID=300843 RepID=A0AAW2R3U0_SESRA
MAILMAFQSPELEILGLTTIFGNVSTEDATRNALLLCEIAGCPDVLVAEERTTTYCRLCSWFKRQPSLPESKKSEKSASEFLVDKVSEYPGEVCILALGPLTNLALAIKRLLCSKVKRVVILGGSFFALGNVNPAAEANIYGDPEAADVEFTSGANIDVGINIKRKSNDRNLPARPRQFCGARQAGSFYLQEGSREVETQGICVGHTLMDQGLKKWNSSNPWTGFSPISVAWTVNVEEVLNYINGILKKP